MKYLKTLGICFIPSIILGIIYTILYYFNIIDNNLFKILGLITIIISIFIGGLYLGKNTKQKGYLEGLKVGFGIFIIFLILNVIFIGFNFINFLYDFLLLIIMTIATMFGITKNKVDN